MNKNSARIALAASLVFVIAFTFFLGIKLSLGSVFSSPDDVYYHTRVAEQIARNIPPVPPPTDTSLAFSGGGSMYVGYHEALALTIRLAGGARDDEHLIVVSKVFHAALSALVFVTFFVVVVRALLRRGLCSRTALWGAALATVTLPALVLAFVYRMRLERPYLLSIILFLALVDALLVRARGRVFLVGLAFPWAFSFSVIAGIPLLAYAVTGALLRVHGWLRDVMITCSALGIGLLVGILLLPDPLYYLYNAIFVHVIALWQSLVGAPVSPAEIGMMPFSIDLVPFLALMALAVLPLLEWKRLRDRNHFELVFLSILTLLFVPLIIYFARAIDFIAPVIVLTVSVLLAFLVREHSSELGSVRRWVLSAAQERVALTAFGLFLLLQPFVYAHEMQRNSWVHVQVLYPQLYAALKEYAAPSDRVLLPSFHLFASAAFYAPTHTLVNGIAPPFLDVGNPELSGVVNGIALDLKGIPLADAPASARELQERFAIRFLVMDFFTETPELPATAHGFFTEDTEYVLRYHQVGRYDGVINGFLHLVLLELTERPE